MKVAILDGTLCTGVTELISVEGMENVVVLDSDSEDFNFLYRKYENGKWSEEKFIPELQEPKSEAEKIQDSILAFQEAFATKYEEDIETNIKRDEVLATIYETVLEGNE